PGGVPPVVQRETDDGAIDLGHVESEDRPFTKAVLFHPFQRVGYFIRCFLIEREFANKFKCSWEVCLRALANCDVLHFCYDKTKTCRGSCGTSHVSKLKHFSEAQQRDPEFILRTYISLSAIGGTTPILYQAKAYWSATSSSPFFKLDAPWPDFVSIRMRTGVLPMWCSCSVAANLNECAGTTRSS